MIFLIISGWLSSSMFHKIEIHPGKINMEHNNGGLGSDDIPFDFGVIFRWTMLIFRVIYLETTWNHHKHDCSSHLILQLSRSQGFFGSSLEASGNF